jgi:hypothetical protein
MPRYHFDLQHTEGMAYDPEGAIFPDPATAIEHAKRVIRELSESDPAYRGWTMVVLDEDREVCRLSFAEIA